MKRLIATSLSLVLLAGALSAGTAHAASDPLAPGPYQAVEAGYTLGDQAFQPTGYRWPVELTGQFYYPSNSRRSSHPVVVFLHGRHATCMTEGSPQPTNRWPCPAGSKPIPNHMGYDYLARHLASQGYAVISISANGISATDAQDTDFGQAARGELVLRHLDLWREWRSASGAPVPRSVVRSLDFTKVGLMGHSRGGEGVVNAVEQNAARPEPYGLKALLPLTPTNMQRRIPINIPLAVVASTCDGDVSDLEGVHYFDDGRYRVNADRSPRHLLTLVGANHNYFNTAWSPSSGLPGARDDWSNPEPASPCHPAGPTRLSEQQQRTAAVTYLTSFFRLHLGGETGFADLWSGARSGAGRVSYHPAAATGQRRDVNRHDIRNDDLNNAGGTTTWTGVTHDICGGDSMEPPTFMSCLKDGEISFSYREPHRGWGFLGVLSQRVSWTEPGGRVTQTVAERFGDVSKLKALRVRVGVDYTDPANPKGVAQNFRIELTDAAGRTASATAGDFGQGLEYPPGELTHGGALPRLLLNPVRIPLSAFAGVDLTSIRTVTYVFDATPTGALALSDLAFTD